ncbi:hypothetical protein M569_02140 [Genlisea aurea]|uniref:EF-hand domain-containing protein n=1 Tax=Genlisea aurea TaxID=192259 RepID=S8CYT9_9LAMI|nr:hypothetical protein M569_02140 [Genlisea aurea]
MRKRNPESEREGSPSSGEGSERRDDSDSPELSSYERQRLQRIEENKKRMEALGLQKTADCFRKSLRMKKISDEEYNPTPEEDDEPSSSGDDVRDDEFSPSRMKKMKNNRGVQINEDELLIHFFQFDETGKGGITAQDVERLAKSQDFTWSEEEISDMITFFDQDGDGKLTLDEFRKIMIRCDMMLIKGSDF